MPDIYLGLRHILGHVLRPTGGYPRPGVLSYLFSREPIHFLQHLCRKCGMYSTPNLNSIS